MIRAAALIAVAFALAGCAEQRLKLQEAPEVGTSESDRLYIMVSSDNSYFIGGQQVEIDDAIAAIKSFASENPDGAVFLEASPDASSGALIELRGSLYNALPDVPVSFTLAAPSDSMVQPEWDALDRVGADTCGMRVVRGFLGRPASEIPPQRLPEFHRILAPTDQATMDYFETRLNVLTDEEGTVIGFKCG